LSAVAEGCTFSGVWLNTQEGTTGLSWSPTNNRQRLAFVRWTIQYIFCFTTKSNQFPFIDWYDASNIPTGNNAFRIYTTWEYNEESISNNA